VRAVKQDTAIGIKIFFMCVVLLCFEVNVNPINIQTVKIR
jgi:hypothetical protein